MSPPKLNGSILFSISSFPYNTPMPIGASILCPDNTKKSASRSWTSIFMCGADCAASTTMIAPTSWALWAIFFISFIVPKTFDTCVTATILTPGTILLFISSSDNSQFSFVYMYSSVAPVFLQTFCHVTKFE